MAETNENVSNFGASNPEECSALLFTLYSSKTMGDPANCLYPQEHKINRADALALAVSRDYVCAEYKNSYRKGDNFIGSDCLPLDCDNDHSDNPDDWITPEQIAMFFTGVSFAVHYSRSHNKPKNGKAARPKFHVLFPISRTTDPEEYAEMKKQVNEIFPYFDTKALDAARFFYGTENPQVIMFDGDINLSEFLSDYNAFESLPDSAPSSTISEGSRNTTMSRFAGRVLKRFGITQKAKELFDERAAQCYPPLSDSELKTIWRSAVKFAKKVAATEGYVPPEEYNAEAPSQWEEPIPFGRYTMSAFPIDTLPKEIGDFTAAVAESTQTPVDMASAIALSVLSVCLQGKFCIQGKADWIEPLNTYVLAIAPPSERKSAVLHMMLRPLNDYEVQYNRLNAAQVEGSKMSRRVLERRQKAIEEQVSKGKAEPKELEKIAQEVAEFKEMKPLQLYVDDITTEKLVSVIAENNGRAALISSEGGIFDTLAGIYTKNVNIDVMLKGYSGDPIRVDRIGRESESVMNPALTVLLMAQPNVVSAVLGNTTFRGRGLTARFLYCMPISKVGERKFDSTSVSESAYRAYERLIINLLNDDYGEKPEIIRLSAEAYKRLSEFAAEIENKLPREYSEFSDWAGKLVGNTLRLAGLLCRAGTFRSHDFLDIPEPLIVSETTMNNAIKLGRYFLNHAQAAYAALPEDDMFFQANKILAMIKEKGLKEFDRRTAMRYCRAFKTTAQIQPVLDFLEDYGYIQSKPSKTLGAGRPPLPKYLVNPWIESNYVIYDTRLSQQDGTS